MKKEQPLPQQDEAYVKPQYRKIYPFRFVKPYNYTYRTFAKQRWFKKSLLQTMVKQFKAYPPEYYENAINEGRIKINNKQVSTDYKIKNGDEIVHSSFRVEPPVLDLPIEIIEQNDDFVIISKPPSIVVHTGGGFHFNSVQNTLKYMYGYQKLFILHRLDKLTSGILIFSKDKQKVAEFHQESEKQIMKKMYLARVNGQVKWNQKELSTLIQCLSHKDGIYRAYEDVQNQQKQGKNAQQQKQEILNKQKPKKAVKSPDIKTSKTVFKKIWYDKDTDSTLLECFPITGRTHQIRVHLQYLGHSILNDTVYGGRFVGNGIVNYIPKQQKQTFKQPTEEKPLTCKGQDEDKQQEKLGDSHKKVKTIEAHEVKEWDYQTRQWQIMLHSYRYIFCGKQYKSRPPYWAQKEELGFKK